MSTRSRAHLRVGAVATVVFALLSCTPRITSAPAVEAAPTLIAVCTEVPHVVAQVQPGRGLAAVGGTSAPIEQRIVAQAHWFAVHDDGIRSVGRSLEAACAAEGSRASFLVSEPASLLGGEELDARASALVHAEAGADFSEAHLVGRRFIEVLRYPDLERAAAITLLGREGRTIPGARLRIGEDGPDAGATSLVNGPWVSMDADAARAISVKHVTGCLRCSAGGDSRRVEAFTFILSISGTHFEFVSPQRFPGPW